MYAKYFVLFAILFTGWFLRKINFIDDRMNNSINKLIVYFAYPCLIVHNIGGLQMTPTVIRQFFITFLISTALFYLYAVIARLYTKARKYPDDISNVSEFAMVLPNNGFMGFPVALIFFGETGLLLMLAHNAAMNIFIFTYGIKLMRRNKKAQMKMTPNLMVRAVFRFLMNPNILGLIVGFIIAFMPGGVPEAMDEYLLYIGNISTPMAMIFIGSSLSNYSLIKTLRDLRSIEAALMKQIWLPAITFAIVYFLPISGVIKCCIVLGCAFPTAATVSMLAEQEGQSISAASSVLLISTLASMATVPGIISILQSVLM